jgi:hypothetical protein
MFPAKHAWKHAQWTLAIHCAGGACDIKIEMTKETLVYCQQLFSLNVKRNSLHVRLYADTLIYVQKQMYTLAWEIHLGKS